MHISVKTAISRRGLVLKEKVQVRKRRSGQFMGALKEHWLIYVFLLPCIIYFIVFHYMPMYGIQIAFRDYKAVSGISGSEWVGLEHFKTFFSVFYFKRLMTNTLLLNVYALIFSFPVPVILALMLNRIRSKGLKKFTQTMIYVPYFISMVVLTGMLYIFLSPVGGIFNTVITALGRPPVSFMTQAGMFRSIYVISGIWQSAGWGTILYIAALTGVDQELYEAAEIDGASIWQKIYYIDLPSLIPIVTMVFILDCGRLLNSNTDKALLMQTPGNIPTSDIIGVYVYNVGIGSGQFSYTAAIGLFTNVINFILIFIANSISKRAAKTSLF